jgi:hypothetical protein
VRPAERLVPEPGHAMLKTVMLNQFGSPDSERIFFRSTCCAARFHDHWVMQ